MAVLILGPAGDGPQAVRLKQAAEIVAADARRIAGTWSRRIPPSVTVTASTNVAVITAGGPEAPMAWTFEQQGGSREGYHPVYGQGPRSEWHWKWQAPRPFLAPAAEAMADAAAGQFANVIDDWARMLGYR